LNTVCGYGDAERLHVAKTSQSVHMFILSVDATHCVMSEPVHRVDGLFMLRCVHSQVVNRLQPSEKKSSCGHESSVQRVQDPSRTFQDHILLNASHHLMDGTNTGPAWPFTSHSECLSHFC